MADLEKIRSAFQSWLMKDFDAYKTAMFMNAADNMPERFFEDGRRHSLFEFGTWMELYDATTACSEGVHYWALSSYRSYLWLVMLGKIS